MKPTLYDSEQWRSLVRAFEFKELEIKPQSISKAKPSALAVPYFDARAVMHRLDEAAGPENWGATYEHVMVTVGGKGNSAFICTLDVQLEGGRIVRQGCADATDIEAAKGAESSSLKRAFSALGAQHLYEIEFGWKECEIREQGDKRYFNGWTKDALANMQDTYNFTIKNVDSGKGVEWLKKLGLYATAVQLAKPLADPKLFMQMVYNKALGTEDALVDLAKSLGGS